MRSIHYVTFLLLVSLGLSLNGKTVVKNTNKPRRVSVKRGSGLNAYKLGTLVRNYYDIVKIWPGNKAHMGFGEIKCAIYSPKSDLKIGDFIIPSDHVYLVFYKKRLMRIRIINPFSGKTGRNLQYFRSLIGALTQKYGKVESTEPIYTRYSGEYVWKKGEKRIFLSYAKLEYAKIPLEQELRKDIQKGKKVNTSDI